MQSASQALSARDLAERCRQSGLKVTPQRVAVYEELCRSGEHPTAEQLCTVLRRRFPNISLDTVNRALLTFARIGVVEIIESFGSPRRYDPSLTTHHHLHCIKCGAVYDFHCAAYDRLRIPEGVGRGFRIIGKRVVLRGICPDCSGSKPRK